MAQRASLWPRLRAMAPIALLVASSACAEAESKDCTVHGKVPLGDYCKETEAPDCSRYPGPAELTLGFGSPWEGVGFVSVEDGQEVFMLLEKMVLKSLFIPKSSSKMS